MQRTAIVATWYVYGRKRSERRRRCPSRDRDFKRMLDGRPQRQALGVELVRGRTASRVAIAAWLTSMKEQQASLRFDGPRGRRLSRCEREACVPLLLAVIVPKPAPGSLQD